MKASVKCVYFHIKTIMIIFWREWSAENVLQVISKSQKNNKKAVCECYISVIMCLKQDGPDPIPVDVKLVVGHKFQTQESRSTKYYCEKCNAMILGVIQKWFRCSGTCSTYQHICVTLKSPFRKNIKNLLWIFIDTNVCTKL